MSIKNVDLKKERKAVGIWTSIACTWTSKTIITLISQNNVSIKLKVLK